MDIEFHYYITGIIAKRAGFNDDDANIIAYASQFVDNNDVVLNVKDRQNKQVYSNYISQTMDISKPGKSLMRIYPIFHYLPGDPMAESARRRDGKMHIINTTPDNEIANDLLQSALKASPDIRPYSIGIATHAYVDSWAHQNFAGFDDSFNGNILNPIPNIGHAEMLHHPDWTAHRWTDDRLVESDVDNNLRFLSAAQRLYENYVDHLKTENLWSVLENDLLSVLKRAQRGSQPYGREERLKHYSQMANGLPLYNEDEWFNEAITQEVHGLRDQKNGIWIKFTIFRDEYWWKEDVNNEDTHWFKFQEAVKEHQALALVPVSKKCDSMGIDIRLL